MPQVDQQKKAQTDSFLLQLMSGYPQYFDTLLRNNHTWGIQIVYSQINRNKRNEPQFTHYYYNTDSSHYFYPASTVKMPAAILALQKLNEMARPGVNKFTAMTTETNDSSQTAVYNDPTTENGCPSIAHYIKKIFLVSDNDAFNRLYEFLGQDYFNSSLQNLGWDNVQMRHRLSVPLTEAQNRRTNPVTFYDTTGKPLYQQPAAKSTMLFQNRIDVLGNGYYSGDSLVKKPFDFSEKNKITLPELHGMLLAVMFPQAVPSANRFKLTEDDYRFLYRYMSMAPRQARFPQYDSTYNDAYVKFLYYGAKDPVDSNISIYNKVGDAYGFLTDAAYIVDAVNGVEFLLSATIHCNSDGIYNDDKYDYETVGFPFLKNLGRVVYDYERNRTRKYKPDLTEWKTDTAENPE